MEVPPGALRENPPHPTVGVPEQHGVPPPAQNSTVLADDPPGSPDALAETDKSPAPCPWMAVSTSPLMAPGLPNVTPAWYVPSRPGPDRSCAVGPADRPSR